MRKKCCALMMLAVTCAVGCTQDSIHDFTFSPETGTQNDLGGEEVGAEDVGLSPDSRLPTEAPVVPDAPADNALCNQYDWCWLHPAPFPHVLSELRPAGDDIHGVANSRYLTGRRSVIWDGSSLSFGPTPRRGHFGYDDMITTPDGWLAVGVSGDLVEVGPQGGRVKLELEGHDFYSLSGVSLDAFVVHRDDGFLIDRDGEVQLRSRTEAAVTDTFMWPNGDIVSVHDSGPAEQRLNGDWAIRTLDVSPLGPGITSIGPEPGSECATAGRFVGVGVDGLRRWDSLEGASEVPYDGGRVTSIGCSPQGGLVIGDAEGRIHLRSAAGQDWETRRVSDEPIEDTAVLGSKLFVSSKNGKHVILDEEETTEVSSGFAIPANRTATEELGSFRDIWASPGGERLVLTHSSGVYYGTPEGWFDMSLPEGARLNAGVLNDEVWGIERPRFAIMGESLWKWDGRTWRDQTTQAFGGDDAAARDIAGNATDNVWVVTEGGIHHFDGDGWTDIGDVSAAVGNSLESLDAEFRSVLINGEDDLIIGSTDGLYRLRRDSGGWQLDRYMDSGCGVTTDIARADDGDLWVVQSNGCVARQVDGAWKERAYPYTSNRRPPHQDTDTSTVLVERPDHPDPLALTHEGILHVGDGRETHRTEFIGLMRDAVYLEKRNIVLALHRQGVVAKYFDDASQE